MKRLKLFPKNFLYTLVLILSITLLASGMIYLLAPIINNGDASGEIFLVEDIPGIAPASIPRNAVITNAVLGSLPYSISVCFVVSLVCAFLFSSAITKPIKHILGMTTHMANLDKNATCDIRSSDEIGMLSKGINELYQKLLSTIHQLKKEKDLVSEAEKQKVDFLRVASLEFWETGEFETWMEQQRAEYQILVNSGDKSFYDKDADGDYFCRVWTQQDLYTLYAEWQEQLNLMKQGYRFTKPIINSEDGSLVGVFGSETSPATAADSTIFIIPDMPLR